MAALTPDALLAAAWQARQSAYCPYSGFAVGAALLLADGRIVSACNVENASLGLSLCAERAALAAGVCAGLRPGGLLAVAVCGGDGAASISPCGACRQVLAEFAAPDCTVFCAGRPGAPPEVMALAALLPRAFQLPQKRR